MTDTLAKCDPAVTSTVKLIIPKPVLIFGAGQVAQVFAEMIGRSSWGGVEGFVVDPGFVSVPLYDMAPIVSSEHMAGLRYREEYRFVIGMSFKGLNKPRAEKFEWMRGLGYEPMTWLAHGVARLASANIGAGTFIMDRNTIQTGVEIGENCVLWSGNHIGHHTKIGNHVWLSSGITVSGACEIGDSSFIGSGVTIADNVKIGRRCIIGAGSLVLKDVPDDSVVAAQGTPISKISSARAARLLG